MEKTDPGGLEGRKSIGSRPQKGPSPTGGKDDHRHGPLSTPRVESRQPLPPRGRPSGGCQNGLRQPPSLRLSRNHHSPRIHPPSDGPYSDRALLPAARAVHRHYPCLRGCGGGVCVCAVLSPFAGPQGGVLTGVWAPKVSGLPQWDKCRNRSLHPPPTSAPTGASTPDDGVPQRQPFTCQASAPTDRPSPGPTGPPRLPPPSSRPTP